LIFSIERTLLKEKKRKHNKTKEINSNQRKGKEKKRKENREGKRQNREVCSIKITIFRSRKDKRQKAKNKMLKK
jgi:hypothetical protein